MTVSDFAWWLRSDGLESLLLAVGVVLAARAVRWVADLVIVASELRDERARQGGLVPSEQSKHERALAQVLAWAVVFLLYFVAGLLILENCNVPLTSLVAPATVAGVAIGFGAQRVVQDLLSGFFLFAERQFGFGDVVRIAPPGVATGISGAVEELTLRTTRLRTLDGELIVIPNGEIRQVTNLSKEWARVVVDVPVPGDADVGAANDLLRRIAADLAADDVWAPLLLDPPSVMGVERMEAGVFHVRLVARTLPGKQWDVGRELRGRVAARFHDAGMVIPPSFATAEPTGP